MKPADETLGLAVRIGALTGIRSASALTAVSVALTNGPDTFRSGPARLLSSPFAALGLKLSAVGEIVADKLPFVPPRTNLAPLLARAALGAFASAAVAQSRKKALLPAAAIGGIAAAASAAMATTFRKVLTDKTPIPNFLVGLAEDAIVVSGATKLAQELG